MELGCCSCWEPHEIWVVEVVENRAKIVTRSLTEVIGMARRRKGREREKGEREEREKREERKG